MNTFKKDYQSGTNFVKAENGDLPADFHNILNRWKTNFSHLFNVNGVSVVRQQEPHKAAFLLELIQALGEILCSDVYKLINSIWNKKELPQQWKQSIIVLVYK
jgi:hypothetical protein